MNMKIKDFALSLFLCFCSLSTVNLLRCGEQYINSTDSDQIDTQIGSFPWTVRISRFNSSSGLIEHFCAGTLISRNYVLTAAHCVLKDEIYKLFIIIGLTGIDDKNENDNLFKILSVVYNKNYRENNKLNGSDIALVKLDRSIKPSQNVNFICLPWSYNDTDDFNQKPGLVTGW